ncbi:MAG: 3' terminal RNA ribose 2'-O-methyltransferase Hen1 [Micropepsaceae bacterium]
MFLSISTTHRPATDLGFILMKHPERMHEVELAFGKAIVFYPVASNDVCEAVLTLDIDPIGLVRGRGEGEGLLDQYVNDRPYAASSFLAVGLNRAFRTAMTGVSKERPELAGQKIPLVIKVCPLPARGGEALLRSLFEPLGWVVAFERIGDSRYVSLTLSGEQRVAEALSHLYVLIPVLDEDKHYWVGDDEVEKLLAKAGGWLGQHPAKETITLRYLKKRRGLARAALARLASEDQAELSEAPQPREAREEKLEAPVRLNDRRMEAVIEALAARGAKSVADLGCGEGKLLGRLVRDRRFERVFGLDASSRALENASERLRLNEAGGPKEGRVTLLHGALTYRDTRWAEADAACLVEVIEHLDADRLPALAQAVFGAAGPKSVVVTTPNSEYNALFAQLEAGTFRHPDHRFEWTRAQFKAWADDIAVRFGYAVTYAGIGDEHAEHGAPTQMAVFAR